MNKDQAKQRIDELKTELARLKEIIEASEAGYPAYGTGYYTISTVGVVDAGVWMNFGYEQHRYVTGNIYLKAKNAETVARMWKKYAEIVGSWRPNGRDMRQEKWVVTHDYSENIAFPNLATHNICVGAKLVFPTREKAQQFIDAFKPEDIALFLGGE